MARTEHQRSQSDRLREATENAVFLVQWLGQHSAHKHRVKRRNRQVAELHMRACTHNHDVQFTHNEQSALRKIINCIGQKGKVFANFQLESMPRHCRA